MITSKSDNVMFLTAGVLPPLMSDNSEQTKKKRMFEVIKEESYIGFSGVNCPPSASFSIISARSTPFILSLSCLMACDIFYRLFQYPLSFLNIVLGSPYFFC